MESEKLKEAESEIDPISKAMKDGDIARLSSLLEPMAALIKSYSESVQSAQERYEKERFFLAEMMAQYSRICHAVVSVGARALEAAEQDAKAIEARRAETLGSVHESAVHAPEGDPHD